MKPHSKLWIIAVLIVVLSAPLSSIPAMAEPGMPGGWSTVTTDDPQVKAAGDQAVSAQAKATGESLKLLSIEAASRQVVAGLNYRLGLRVSRNGRQTTATAMVWAKLDGSYQLTDWSWGD